MVQREFLSALCAAVLVFAPATDVLCQATAPHDVPRTHAIRAGLLIDPVEGTALSDQTILVVDGVVTAVGSDVSIPQGIPVIEESLSHVV